MVVKYILNDGKKDRSDIFRNVIRGRSLAQIVENFYSFRNDMRYGILIELKGKERKILHTFGKFENGETVTGALALKYIQEDLPGDTNI